MMNISVAARTSPLSKAQVQEVLEDLKKLHPSATFHIHYLQTVGDLDQKTSLRSLGKTDFFTREIDQMVLSGTCRIAIHSAKDLPEPLPVGIYLAAITKGLDPADVLVFRNGDTLDTLPPKARIGTSSERREAIVKSLRKDLNFIDIRGTIEQRLAKLNSGEADAIVVAEAALIRLGLTHLNRMRLPGTTVPGQGQLAIVAREDDAEMIDLFSCLARG